MSTLTKTAETSDWETSVDDSKAIRRYNLKQKDNKVPSFTHLKRNMSGGESETWAQNFSESFRDKVHDAGWDTQVLSDIGRADDPMEKAKDIALGHTSNSSLPLIQAGLKAKK